MPSSHLPLWVYRGLLLVGGAALVGVGWVYQFGAPTAVDPRAWRLAIGVSALALFGLTFTSAVVRRRALSLIYGMFVVVSAWQIYVATAGGLTPTAAFGVLLVFLGCSAGIQAPRPLAVYTVVFVGSVWAASMTLDDPGVPRGAFLSTLGALGALGVFVARARRQSMESIHRAKEEALDAARAKSEFLAAMSHEIRTPLNGVIGMTDVLSATRLSAAQQDYVSTIQASGRALLGVINDVLDFSKIEAGKLDLEAEAVDLRALADDAASVVAQPAAQKGVEIVCRVDPEVPAAVLGDGTRIRQIVLNLLSNAVKFTPAGTVSLRVSARSRRGTAEILLEIADTGIGIPADHLDTLFDSFTQVDASTTRRFGGTGLGLAITKRLAEQMGGTVRVESVAGEGSTFTVTLSLPEIEGRPEVPRPTGAVLLVVEAHTDAREALGVLAEMSGLTVQPFATAAAALDWVRDGGRFDLAALALDDGAAFTLAGDLRAEPSGGRPLMLLAPLGSSVSAGGLFDAVVAKPVRSDRFQAVVAGLTGAAERVPDAAPPSPPATDLRVLLVEDHEVNRKVAVGLLARLGVVPDVAEDGQQGLDALAEADYDLVLMDLQMPVLDGLEATRRLRARPGHQPRVVALTANAFAEDAARCREAGMDGFLTKPVRLSDLEAEIGRTQGEPTTAPPAAPAEPLTTGRPTPDTLAAHLRALAEGDDVLATEILDAYLRTEASLRADLVGDDPAGTAHKLKAACGTLGADALAHAAHEIERDARDSQDVADQVRRMVEDLVEFRETVAAARDRLAASSPATTD